MLSDALHHVYNRARWGLLFRGLIALALGIFIIARTLESVAAFALVIAIWALVTGLFHIVDAIELRSLLPHWWILLISGLVSAGFGIAAFYYYPVLSLTFAVIWTGYWLLLSGFLGIYVAAQERKMGTPWLWTLAFGLLSVLAGVYAIAFPPATLAVIMGLIAAFAIVGGIVLLFGFFRLTSARSQLAGASAPARA
jgi:uncharacterized membrane protein HdeD (DUF308 family)